jgi:hypothetical protein
VIMIKRRLSPRGFCVHTAHEVMALILQHHAGLAPRGV